MHIDRQIDANHNRRMALTEFKLDTSGVVRLWNPAKGRETIWPDLSPFVQGYTRRGMEELNERLFKSDGYTEADFIGYLHLAPETLVRIMEDCAAVQEIIDSYPGRPDLQQAQGRDFWTARQNGKWSVLNRIVRFPPLTLSLGDDGNAVFV